MASHWKFGNDFAIRYGGRGNIAWFSNGDTTRAPDPDEEVAALTGVPLLAASLGIPQLPSGR